METYDCWSCRDGGLETHAHQHPDGRVFTIRSHCHCQAGTELKARDELEREDSTAPTLDTLDREDS